MNLISLMKYYFYYIFLHLTLAGSSLIQIGDAISVNVDSFITYKHASNILKSAKNEKSDGIFIFSPGAVINFGTPGTIFDLKAKANYNIIQYTDYSNLDKTTSKINLNGSYAPSSVLRSRFSYSNLEGQHARSESDTIGAPALIETTTESYSFNTNYLVSPKISLSVGFKQSELSYDTYSDQLSSKKDQLIPLNFNYNISNKLSLVHGISLFNVKVGQRIGYFNDLLFLLPPYEMDSVYYNIGLNGTILPKLTGGFDVGYRTVSYSYQREDANSFGANSALTWKISPKFKTTLNLSKDFDVSGSGSSYNFNRGQINALYSINSEYRLSYSIARTNRHYKTDIQRLELSDRKESYTSTSLDMYYIPSKNLSLIFGLNSIKSKAKQDFDYNEFRFTCKLLY